MDFSIKAFDTKNTLAAAKSGCVAVAVFENKKLSAAAKALDQNGDITAALKSGDITGKPGSTAAWPGPPRNAYCWLAWARTRPSARKTSPPRSAPR
jgi:hypothetical protein